MKTMNRDDLDISVTKREYYLTDSRNIQVNASPGVVYQVFIRLGGEEGWLFFDWVWRIRGFFDRLIGGVGMRTNERDFEDLKVGDTVDFWIVEKIRKDQILRFRSEMKAPGLAWLEFKVQDLGKKQSILNQTAYFIPNGFWGKLYWYGLYPIHILIFSGMIKRIAKKAEEEWHLDNQVIV